MVNSKNPEASLHVNICMHIYMTVPRRIEKVCYADLSTDLAVVFIILIASNYFSSYTDI